MEREAKAKQKDIDVPNLQQPQQLPSPAHPLPSSVPHPHPLPVPSPTAQASAASAAFPPSAPPPPPGLSGALPPAPVVPSSYRRASPPKLEPIHMGGGPPPLHPHHTHNGSIGNASAISPLHSQPQPPLSATSIVHSPFDLRYSQPPQTAHSATSFHDIKPGTAGGESADDSTPDMEDNIYPARIVDKEKEKQRQRQNYFRTILNPSSNEPHQPHRPKEVPTRAPTPPPKSANIDLNVRDPIAAGVLDEQMAVWLLDQCV
jgi:hypothetical protein